MNRFKKMITILVMAFLLIVPVKTDACTGVRLNSKDGGVIFGRTMEWGAFDLNTRITIVPEGYTFNGLTPEGQNGKSYSAKYGFVGLDMLKKDLYADGMNEAGLTIGMFYFPGFCVYPDYNPTEANNTISAQEVTNYILSTFANVNEVKEGMPKVNVAGVIDESIGIVVGSHWMVTDKNGESIVIEYTKGELVIHDAPLGVITNAPNYDWHVTNVNNYVGLSNQAHTQIELDGEIFKPLGAGSGMFGLPGDNTPPSRFIRAVAWSQTARSVANSNEAVYELFRILDNFNLPLGPDGAEGASGEVRLGLMRASTIWTSAWNISDMTLNYHTMHNRRVRQFDLKKIYFSKLGNNLIHLNLDESKEQDIQERTL
ncbi:linear amide C-N hydrolase [Saccharicrinis aurantiacus]|uniref:linear amide C-N hydrolase n=1 Tax=Saccharicrinis aurantiacus TaxID=1849719 RepID=UPI00094F54CC|nr:choloylglycine hydrolase family protein [Saccharicrinis aurantiacus]